MKKIGFLMILLFGFYSEAGANDHQFVSNHYEYNYNLSGDRLALWGANYGHSIISQSVYYGFFSTGMKFYIQKLPAKQDLELSYFLDLRYGYEFMRKSVFPFGLEISWGVGFVENNKPIIQNKLGIFGRWKIIENFSILVRTGLGQHNSPDTQLKDVANNKLFGPYIQVEARSYF